MRTLSFAHNQSEIVAGHGNASVPQKMGDMLEAAKIVTPYTIQQRIVVQTEMAKDAVDGPKIMSSDTVHRRTVEQMDVPVTTQRQEQKQEREQVVVQ